MNSFFEWIKAFIFWSDPKKTMAETKEQQDLCIAGKSPTSDLERWIIEFEQVADKV